MTMPVNTGVARIKPKGGARVTIENVRAEQHQGQGEPLPDQPRCAFTGLGAVHGMVGA